MHKITLPNNHLIGNRLFLENITNLVSDFFLIYFCCGKRVVCKHGKLLRKNTLLNNLFNLSILTIR